MTAIGLAMGGDARTGLEDTLTVGHDIPAESNAQLVERLVTVVRSLEREPASSDVTLLGAMSGRTKSPKHTCLQRFSDEHAATRW